MLDMLARIAPTTAYTSGDMLGADILVEGGPKLVTVTISVDTARKFYLNIGAVNMPFNTDVNLTANALYDFSFMANGKDSFNFQLAGSAAINYFTVVQSLT